MNSKEAFKKAQEIGYDLVEVAPMASPPVCKIMDYGKYKYEQNKKQHSTKLHQRGTQLKEIKLRLRTDKHDIEYKVRHLKKFLEEGNKTKVTLMFRGRERAYSYMGRTILDKIGKEIGEYGTVEQPPKLEGSNMTMVIGPISKQK